jgi:hypothetical protein
MSDSKCNACGLPESHLFKRVRTTNGGLLLCEQCLADINRKNPELRNLRDVVRLIIAVDNYLAGVRELKKANPPPEGRT